LSLLSNNAADPPSFPHRLFTIIIIQASPLLPISLQRVGGDLKNLQRPKNKFIPRQPKTKNY